MPVVYTRKTGDGEAELYQKDVEHPEDVEPIRITDAAFAFIFND